MKSWHLKESVTVVNSDFKQIKGVAVMAAASSGDIFKKNERSKKAFSHKCVKDIHQQKGYEIIFIWCLMNFISSDWAIIKIQTLWLYWIKIAKPEMVIFTTISMSCKTFLVFSLIYDNVGQPSLLAQYTKQGF